MVLGRGCPSRHSDNPGLTVGAKASALPRKGLPRPLGVPGSGNPGTLALRALKV